MDPKKKEERWNLIKFQALLKKWREETAYTSDVRRMIANRHYQEMMSMGSVIVPFIIEDFKRGKVYHFFLALRELTGENPVPRHHAGSTEAMAGDWIRWSREKGLVK